jgi:hypothetical protein
MSARILGDLVQTRLAPPACLHKIRMMDDAGAKS